MSRAIALLALCALAPQTGAAQDVLPGTYSAHVEVRTGTCCSASCGAVSTLADVTLALASDASATFHWVRTGCGVTIRGSGPTHMPRDPGPPEAVCAMRGAGAEQRALDADVTQHGTWRTESGETLVTLDRATTLRCAPATISARTLLACRIESSGIDATGLTLSGQLYLDRRPGLRERLDASDQLVVEHR